MYPCSGAPKVSMVLAFPEREKGKEIGQISFYKRRLQERRTLGTVVSLADPVV